jgi:hypothetical protein
MPSTAAAVARVAPNLADAVACPEFNFSVTTATGGRQMPAPYTEQRQLHFLLHPADIEKLRKVARAHQRSMGGELRVLVAQHLSRHREQLREAA